MNLVDGAAVRETIGAFAEDDPRRPDYSPDELAEAVRDAGSARRWHVKGADWLAVRLAYGRGVAVSALCKRFGIGETTLRRRAHDEAWTKRLSERDARRMSRRVWLAGLARGVADPGEAAELAAVSVWTPVRGPDGAGTDLAGLDVDPREAERREVRRRLDELVANLDTEIAKEQAAASGTVADSAVS